MRRFRSAILIPMDIEDFPHLAPYVQPEAQMPFGLGHSNRHCISIEIALKPVGDFGRLHMKLLKRRCQRHAQGSKPKTHNVPLFVTYPAGLPGPLAPDHLHCYVTDRRYESNSLLSFS